MNRMIEIITGVDPATGLAIKQSVEFVEPESTENIGNSVLPARDLIELMASGEIATETT
jgi:hypothetical protein